MKRETIRETYNGSMVNKMCIICVEMEKNKLTPWEAKRNLSEMVAEIGEKHAREVENNISDMIYDEISLQFGETLHESEKFCNFCENLPCYCEFGE